MLDLVKIKLDKERNLRLTLKGMVEFEKLTGRNLLKKFNFNDMSLSDSAALVWACLIHEDDKLTYNAVLNMIDFSNLSDVLEAVTECLNKSLTKAEESDVPLVEKPQAG